MAEKTHSKMYQQLKAKYDAEYVTKETLQGWVRLNAKKATKGITAEEYAEITGEEFPEDEEGEG